METGDPEENIVECTEKELLEISKKLVSHDYITFGRFLRLTYKQLEEIENHRKRNTDTNYIHHMLKQWKKLKGSEAKKDDLIDALKNVERNDIVEEIYPGHCTEKELLQISVKIKNQYRSLARKLDVSEETVDDIEKICTDNQYGEVEILYQILRFWRRNKGAKSIKNELVRAMKEIGKKEVIDEVFIECRSSVLSKGLLRKLEENQRETFKELELYKCIWFPKCLFNIEDFVVELRMKSLNKEWKEEMMKIEKIDIFENYENVLPHRIFIEGNEGYGKSALILSFLYDWSQEKEYISNKFDLIFVISLRYFKGKLEDHFFQQCREIEARDEDKLQAIESNQNKILLFLDGLDETSKEVKDILFPLVKGYQYPNMTVVVTCRTGHYHFDTETANDLKQMGIKHHYLWDKMIEIIGITKDMKLEYLQKYLNIDADVLDKSFQIESKSLEMTERREKNCKDLEIFQEVNETKSNLASNLNEFYECPIFLLLITILTKEGKLVGKVTENELYKTLLNYIVKKSLDYDYAYPEKKDREFDVFDLNSKEQLELSKLLIKFGCLCLEKFKEHSILFEEREILNYSSESSGENLIFKLGILYKEPIYFRHAENTYYKLIHRSFIEFFAAFYLSSLEENEMKRKIDELIDLKMYPHEYEFFYILLTGFGKNIEIQYTTSKTESHRISKFRNAESKQ